MTLSLFTGKGGVGKSTVVAAAAVEAARRGRRPLIVELGHRASMGAIFSAPEIGHEPREVEPGVFATNIDLDATLSDYVRRYVRVKRLARRISDSRSLRRFFQAAPAVGEVLTLHRLEGLLEAGYDPVLVDLDATGHALMFLELPRVFDQLVPSGPVRDLLDRFTELLTDPKKTRLHLVTLPDTLPLRETVALIATLRRDHGAVPLGTLFVNQVPARPFPEAEDAALDAMLESLADDHPAREDQWLLERAREHHRRAHANLLRYETTGLTRVELPKLSSPFERSHLRTLGASIGVL